MAMGLRNYLCTVSPSIENLHEEDIQNLNFSIFDCSQDFHFLALSQLPFDRGVLLVAHGGRNSYLIPRS